MFRWNFPASLLFGLALSPAVADSVDDERKALEGTWILVQMRTGTEKFQLPKEYQIEYVFKGSKVSVRHGGKAESFRHYRVDPSKTPKHFDMEEGKETIRALYEVKEDVLKVALPLGVFSRDRPTALDPPQGLSYLAIFKRKDEPRKKGAAKVEQTRPDYFPHRIWAACDFEARTPDYAWFGPAETANIPKYPGNLTALGVKDAPYGKFAALMTGINPVPGPMMGKVNKMYCRYFLKGGSEATFQHFSLTRNDNNHIRVSGLTEGTWAEVTLNFTRDAARNDGSKEAFVKGERMDD